MIRHLRYFGLLLPFLTSSSWATAHQSAVHIARAGKAGYI